MNIIILSGRLTRDPEIKTTNTGKSVCSFTIAVDKKFKPKNEGDPDADFFRCTAWGQTAEFIVQWTEKGGRVELTGRVENRKFTDKDGNQREVAEVVVEDIKPIDWKKKGEGAPSGSTSSKPKAAAPVVQTEEYDPFADD